MDEPAHEFRQLIKERLLSVLLVKLLGHLPGQNHLLHLCHGETSFTDLLQNRLCWREFKKKQPKYITDPFVYLAHVYKLFYTEQEWTFVFLNGIRLDHCQCLLFGEEKVDLPHCLLVTFAAVQLVDWLVLHSKLGSQTSQ